MHDHCIYAASSRDTAILTPLLDHYLDGLAENWGSYIQARKTCTVGAKVGGACKAQSFAWRRSSTGPWLLYYSRHSVRLPAER